MMLAHILDYLERHDSAGVDELARRLGSSPDAVRGMLDTLCQRGLAHRFEPSSGCGSRCQQCRPSSGEHYCRGPGPHTFG